MKIKTILLLVVLSFAALSPAPHIDKGNQKGPIQERSQEQVAQEQAAYQMTQGETAVPPTRTDYTHAPDSRYDGDARSALSAASNQEGDEAANVLRAASKNSSSGASKWIWMLGFGVLGLVGVMGLRAWVVQSTPTPPGLSRRR
ncbi:MAG: hypothetical protein CNCCGFBP_00801 [Fimbriimonadaceae bacterium]|nr:hypothetical protein [Fimbriimonadaceae bacterium]